MGFDSNLERSAPATIRIGAAEVRRGSRVRLHPRGDADTFDTALNGRIAVVAGIEQDLEERVHIAVTLEDDPGQGLGGAAQLGHRFFFAPDEIEPLAAGARVLVAGIGNVFLADDGFGVAVAARLLARSLRDGVTVMDFGIRGLDLAYCLQDDWRAVILIDAAPRGELPGTLSVIEPELDRDDDDRLPDAHGMDPVHVLRLARRLGSLPPCVRLVACEPATVTALTDHQIGMELSAPVQDALDDAVALVERLVDDVLRDVKEVGT
jgi:hydrogenase maturation protease